MLKKVERLFRCPFKLIPIVVFGILLTATMNIVIATINYNEINERSEAIKIENREAIWHEIESSIIDSYNANRLVTGQLALKIENGIIREYDDMEVLRGELESGNLGNRFHTVVTSTVKQSDPKPTVKPYLTLVGTRDNLIIAATNNENKFMRQIDTESLLSWKSLIALTPNKDMTKNAYDMIFANGPQIIFTQTSDRHVKGDIYTDIHLDTLRKVYETQGLSGLYDFSILTPGFITESGDIFGTADRYYLSRNHNHKMIVVQVISLESILKDHVDEFALVIENNTMEEKSVERYMIHQLITTATITLMLFIISLVLIGIHNAEMDRKRRAEGVDS